jgi:very-short-patch-repair endonuclease
MENEDYKKLIGNFLDEVINFPYDFEIISNPNKIWVPYKGGHINGYYFNHRFGKIENLPTIVLTPKSSLKEWISCNYKDESILTADYKSNSIKTNRITEISRFLEQLFKEKKIYPKGLNTSGQDYYNQFQFKFDYNNAQSEFLFKLNNYVKEISQGLFKKVYVSADPHCAKPITVNFVMDKFNRKVIEKVKELLQKKFTELEFNFVREQWGNLDTIDLRWSESDPKNWDKDKKENYRISTFNKFKEEAIDKFGNIYEYYLDNFVDMNTHTKVFCKKHKSNFDVLPTDHLKGKRCPKDIESSGENMVRTFLESKKISYLQYHKMKGCFSEKNGRCYLLTFDFYIPSKNLVIEYDGGQHFGPVSIFGGEESYKRTIMLDAIKNEFCKDNNIKMLRIPYTKTTEEAHQMLNKELGL